MFGHLLTSEERQLVDELRGTTRDVSAYMKLSVLILLDMDKSYDEIEAILGIGRGSISNCRKKYESDGLDKYTQRKVVCEKFIVQVIDFQDYFFANLAHLSIP